MFNMENISKSTNLCSFFELFGESGVIPVSICCNRANASGRFGLLGRCFDLSSEGFDEVFELFADEDGTDESDFRLRSFLSFLSFLARIANPSRVNLSESNSSRRRFY